MINKELLNKFWKDYYITTQEERPDFPYANIADAGKALIKGRNWTGTFTELLLDNSNMISACKQDLNHMTHDLSILERNILIEGTNSSAYKNKDSIKRVIWSKATEQQREEIQTIEKQMLDCGNELEGHESDKQIVELILKKLDKTTDWLVQYINWMKFEIRGLQQ